jgi:antitoxin VapB
MDGSRLVEEQVPGQGYELVTLYWHEGSPVDKILELTKGMKVAADFGLPGARCLSTEITDLHYPLTDLDLKRIHWVGRKSDQILTNIALELRLGISEQEVAAQILLDYAREGMTIDVLIVGFDERISRYRHCIASTNRLGRYALLHPAVRRWGLHANVTRLVHFGEPAESIRKAMDGVIYIGASVAAMLKPGLRFSEILEEEKRLYHEVGFPDEWHNHFQGGITGYTLADPSRCLDPKAVTVSRQAYDYFITITGAKFEELTLLTETGVEIASLGDSWPTRSVETKCGALTVPDVMIR